MTAPAPEYRAARVFASDARVVLALANHARYLALRRVFGVSREQANLLTFVLALGATQAGYTTARRVVQSPLHLSGTDVGLGAFAVREAALVVAGPTARDVPGLGVLVAFAMIGGLAFPSLRRAAHGARIAEQRPREPRVRAFAAVRGVAPPSDRPEGRGQ